MPDLRDRLGTPLAMLQLMSAVKIGPSRQVVIPKHIYDELELAPGDYLEATHQGGKLVFTPKALVDKPLPASLARAPLHEARPRRAARTKARNESPTRGAR